MSILEVVGKADIDAVEHVFNPALEAECLATGGRDGLTGPGGHEKIEAVSRVESQIGVDEPAGIDFAEQAHAIG